MKYFFILLLSLLISGPPCGESSASAAEAIRPARTRGDSRPIQNLKKDLLRSYLNGDEQSGEKLMDLGLRRRDALNLEERMIDIQKVGRTDTRLLSKIQRIAKKLGPKAALLKPILFDWMPVSGDHHAIAMILSDIGMSDSDLPFLRRALQQTKGQPQFGSVALLIGDMTEPLPVSVNGRPQFKSRAKALKELLKQRFLDEQDVASAGYALARMISEKEFTQLYFQKNNLMASRGRWEGLTRAAAGLSLKSPELVTVREDILAKLPDATFPRQATALLEALGGGAPLDRRSIVQLTQEVNSRFKADPDYFKKTSLNSTVQDLISDYPDSGVRRALESDVQNLRWP